jgi:hypothetical protein
MVYYGHEGIDLREFPREGDSVLQPPPLENRVAIASHALRWSMKDGGVTVRAIPILTQQVFVVLRQSFIVIHLWCKLKLQLSHHIFCESE